MSRKISLSIACLIDEDIARPISASITPGRTISNAGMSGHDRIRVKYDASVILGLREIYRDVKVVTAIEASTATIDELARLKPDVVFNLAFSAVPYEAAMAGCLDLLGIPYTGSGPLGIALGNDKIRSRHLLRSAGVNVPRFIELPPDRPVAVGLDPPLIVKPVSLSSSVGVNSGSVVRTVQEVEGLAKRIWQRYSVPAVCEEFIVGREFRVAIVEAERGKMRVAGATEWHFGAARSGWGFRTEAMKASRSAQRAAKVSRTVVPRNEKICSEFAAIGQRAAAALDISGYATMDLRMNDHGRITVIEVNPNPGIWGGGSTWSNPSFEVNLKRIVKAAIRKARK